MDNFWDIGTHVNLAGTPNGKTISDRLKKATAMAKRLRWMTIPAELKEKVVRANVLPAGLYGVEAARVSKSAMQSLKAHDEISSS